MNTSSVLLPASRLLGLAACSLAAALPSARATLLVYEGVNGYTTGSLAAQKPNDSTVGLDKTKGYYDGASPSRAGGYTVQSTGLTFGPLETSGGALSFNGGTNVIGPDLDLGSIAFTGTLWSSYLVTLSARGTAAADGVVIRIGDTPADSTGNHFSSWADSRQSSTAVAVGYSKGNTAVNGTGSLALGTTYIIISEFTRVGESVSTGTPGVATSWALTESQFAAFLADGGDEAALARASVTATAMHSTGANGTQAFSSSQSIGIITVNDSGVLDELRYGSTLADVIPIPEPATAALLAGLGCGVFLLLRRSRRHGPGLPARGSPGR